MVSCVAPKGVYTIEACTSPEDVYITGPELHLDVSTLKRPVLLLDMSTLQACVPPERVYITETRAAPSLV
jgi:hypothetical protein